MCEENNVHHLKLKFVLTGESHYIVRLFEYRGVSFILLFRI
jgi:hypothetical protein